MYADAKFQALSPPKPSGQSLWLYLLTGPHTNLVPGLFSAGRAGLAEAIGWGQDDFDRCWEELVTQGVAQAAWKDRVVWIPNAIRHNEPASPSVVVSWRSHWPLIPECNLKWTAYKHLRNYLETKKGPGFASAFVSACLVPEAHLVSLPEEQAASQPAAHPASHQEQEAGAGTGAVPGTGTVVVPTAPKPRRGIGVVAEVWDDLGFPRDLANSGETFTYATAVIASGVDADHVARSLRAAHWFVENGAGYSLLTIWKNLVEKTTLGGKFRWDGEEAPDVDAGEPDGEDPVAGTGYRLARPKAHQRIGRLT